MRDAFIWGASGGMGRALVTTLVNDGWRVFAAARNESNIPDGAYQTYAFEASDGRSIQNIAVDLAQETDGLDLWVYLAGELQADLLRKMSPETWDNVLHSNLTGAFTTFSQTNHFVNDGGQVAFVGAYIDHLILPKMGAYAVAKAGLETLAQVLQKEHRKLNLTVVKPGAVNTPFWENAPFKMPASAKSPQVVVDALLAWTNAGKRGSLEL